MVEEGTRGSLISSIKVGQQSRLYCLTEQHILSAPNLHTALTFGSHNDRPMIMTGRILAAKVDWISKHLDDWFEATPAREASSYG